MLIEVIVCFSIAYLINETATSREIRDALFAVLVSYLLMASFLSLKNMILKDMKAQDNFCIYNNWELESSNKY